MLRAIFRAPSPVSLRSPAGAARTIPGHMELRDAGRLMVRPPESNRAVPYGRKRL